MESGGVGGQRRRAVEKPDSRDLLRVKDDDGINSLAGLTLSAVLGNQTRPAPAQRTLFDIIRDDPTGGFKGNKKSWKVFRDKFRLRRAGAAWTSIIPVPTSDLPIQNNNRMMSRRNSTRLLAASGVDPDNPNVDTNQLETEMSSSEASGAISGGLARSYSSNNKGMMLRRNSTLAFSREGRISDPDPSLDATDKNDSAIAIEEVREPQEPEAGATAEQEGGGEEPAKMSLMALLADSDEEGGLDSFMSADGDDEEEEESASNFYTCCVCMVRHKGTAFIPCGHTFCRLCSRELYVERGHCPFCNRFIMEILDIF